MDYKRWWLIHVIMLTQINLVNGQNLEMRALKVGDTVPDVAFKMINYKSNKAHLSEFRGKLLILDFWGAFCSTCIAQFSKLTELQKQFNSELNIIPVGFDTYEEKSIEKAFLKRKGTPREIKLPSAISLNGIPKSWEAELLLYGGANTCANW